MDKYIILFIIAFVSLLSKNKILMYASFTMIVICFVGVNYKNLLALKSKTLNFSLYLLTLSILIPISMGKITLKDLIKTVTSLEGIIAIVIGILVSILSTKGIVLQQINPLVVIAISLGTIVGIGLFGGTASGPIIASGMTYVIIQIINKFYGS